MIFYHKIVRCIVPAIPQQIFSMLDGAEPRTSTRSMEEALQYE